MLWLVPLGAPLLFLLRGIGDYMSASISRATSARQIIKAIRARPVPPVPASAGEVLRPRSRRGTMLSRLTFNIEQVAEATTKSITSLIRDSLTIVVLIG